MDEFIRALEHPDCYLYTELDRCFSKLHSEEVKAAVLQACREAQLPPMARWLATMRAITGKRK